MAWLGWIEPLYGALARLDGSSLPCSWSLWYFWFSWTLLCYCLGGYICLGWCRWIHLECMVLWCFKYSVLLDTSCSCSSCSSMVDGIFLYDFCSSIQRMNTTMSICEGFSSLLASPSPSLSLPLFLSVSLSLSTYSISFSHTDLFLRTQMFTDTRIDRISVHESSISGAETPRTPRVGV